MTTQNLRAAFAGSSARMAATVDTFDVSTSGTVTFDVATSGTATLDVATSGTATSDTATLDVATSGTATSDTATFDVATSDTATLDAATADALALRRFRDNAIDTGPEIIPTTTTADAAGPVGLRWATAWHAAPRQLPAVAMDLIVAASVVLAATGSRTASLVMVTALLLTGMLTGVWKRRMPIQTQGVLWFARLFVPAAAVAAVVTWSVTSSNAAIASFLSTASVLIVIRGLLWAVIGRYRRRGAGLQRTLVVGPAHRMPHIEYRMEVFPEAGLKFAAAYVPQPGDGLTAKTGREMVDRLLSTHRVEHVLFVVDEINERVFKDFLRFGGGRADFSVVMPLAPVSANEARAHIGDMGLIPMQLLPSWGSQLAKRVFDVAASVVLLAVLSPLLVAAAIAIRLDTSGKAIFKQRRVGREGRTFTIYKFRSMVDGAEHLQGAYLAENVREHLLFKVQGDPRITRVGHLIRRLSIDELPQLFNVVKGDMSLVGPRPLAVDPDDFDPAAQIRHWAVPGITGLWQVHGANALSYQDMVELDLAYMATRSLAVDLGLIVRTIPALLVRRSAAY